MSKTSILPGFHLLAKPTGAACNLGCKYCFFLSKKNLYPGSSFRMSDELLEVYIRQYIQAQKAPLTTIAWQGGKPTLMGLDFFKKSIQIEQKYRRPNMILQNTMQTNGTLLDDEWCEFFHDNNFLIGLSLDGPRELHDAYRVDKSGKPTFDRVIAGLDALKRRADGTASNQDRTLLATIFVPEDKDGDVDALLEARRVALLRQEKEFVETIGLQWADP